MEDPPPLTVALHRGLYLAIITDRFRGPQTALSIALPGGLCSAFIIDRYGGPQTALSIAFLRCLYFAIKMER
jgi:hypothetical protein